MAKPKVRGKNWTENEAMFLTELIENDKHKILENKGVSSIEKAKAWEDIQVAFTDQGYARNDVQIKEKWQRMKRESKSNVTVYKTAKINSTEKIVKPSKVDWKMDLLAEKFAAAKIKDK